MAESWQRKQVDADGLTLKDRIWRYVCEYLVRHSVPPDWGTVKFNAKVPDLANQEVQRSHASAAVHYMKTGTLPSDKAIPVLSDDFVRQQRESFLNKSRVPQRPSATAKTEPQTARRQPDPFFRRQVENAAVEVTIKAYLIHL